MKTNELTGPALDWAVAKCEGLDYWHPETGPSQPEYSTVWAQGGPIIEREKLGVWHYGWDEYGNEANNFYAEDVTGDHVRVGPTPLIAAMRCFVASRLGDEVEIPEELQ